MRREDKTRLAAISTYQKYEAVERLANSYVEHGYHETSILLLGCDNAGQPYTKTNGTEMPSVKELYAELKGKGIDVALGFGQSRSGVWGNKNRLIHMAQSMENPWNSLLVLDDDQYFDKSGLFDYLEDISARNNINHLTGVWAEAVADIKPGLSGKNWYDDFPVVSESKDGLITWHGGCHGNVGWFSKKCIDRIGYYNKWQGFYGYEHTEYTARAMRAVEKRSTMWYPQVNTSKYLRCQAIPNNYSGTDESIKKNGAEFYEKMEDIAQGLNLRVKEPGIDLKKETILRSWE